MSDPTVLAVLILSGVLATLVQEDGDGPQSQELELRWSADAEDDVRGALPFTADSSGSLTVWFARPATELALEVALPSGELVMPDADRDPRASTLITVEVEQGDVLQIRARTLEDGGGEPRAHLFVAPETELTRAAAAAAMDWVHELERTAREKEPDSIVAVTTEHMQRVLDTPEFAGSAALHRTLNYLAYWAHVNGGLETGAKGWRIAYEFFVPRLPPDDGFALTLLGNRANKHMRERELERAEELYQRELVQRLRLGGDDDPKVLLTRGNIALVRRNRGDLAGALEAQELILESYERLVRGGEMEDSNRVYVNTISDIGWTLFELGRYERARALFERELTLRQHAGHPRDPQLAYCRMRLGSALRWTGHLQEALEHFQWAYDLIVETLPPDHPQQRHARTNLGTIFEDLGQLSRAAQLFEEAYAGWLKHVAEDDPDLQRARQNLAGISLMLGDRKRTRELQEQVLEAYEKTLPEGHPKLSEARLNVADVLRGDGSLERAQKLQERVLDNIERAGEPAPLLRAEALEGLAKTRRDLGDRIAALDLLDEVLTLRLGVLPEGHERLLEVRENQAGILYGLGRTASALELRESILAARLERYEANHPWVQDARGNLAISLRGAGDLARAAELEEAVLEVRLAADSPEDPRVQLGRVQLAHTELQRGHTIRALELLTSALNVQRRILPREHRNLKQTWMLLAWAHVGHGNPDAAREAAHALAASLQRGALVTAASAAPREREVWALTQDFWLSQLLSLSALLDDPLLEREAFDAVESVRGIGLVAARALRGAKASTELEHMRLELQRAEGRMASIFSREVDQAELAQAVRARDRLQRELIDAAGLVAEPTHSIVDKIARSLDEHEAWVGWWTYQRRRGPEHVGEDALLAFTVRADGSLHRFELGALDEVHEAVLEWRAALGVRADGVARGIGFATGGVAPQPRGLAAGRALRALVFDRLAAGLEGAQRLIIVPDGPLHLVSLDALPARHEKGRRLGDVFGIETRSTALADSPRAEPTNAGLLLIAGGLDYGTVLDTEPRVGRSFPGAPAAGFQPLPACAVEVDEIARLARRRPAGAVRLLAGKQALVEVLRELAPRTQFLHLATHGFCSTGFFTERPLGAPAPEAGLADLSPMSLCGLALSGANLPSSENRRPGIVTAEELATWDFSACELAVLSACDTGAGLASDGQGLASLQKALQMAGARGVITSLWKVPDEATQELMVSFYKNLWERRLSAPAALWRAKVSLRERGYPDSAWAAWVWTGSRSPIR